MSVTDLLEQQDALGQRIASLATAMKLLRDFAKDDAA